MQRYFIDTEFSEGNNIIDFISIGIVSDDGREFYEISNQFDAEKCNPWVQNNILPLLPIEFVKPRSSNIETRDKLINFVGPGEEIEFWTYYGSYDWVCVCQLFGAMVNLPENWPMFAMDIKQEAVRLGNPKLPATHINNHNALADAKWNRLAYNFLKTLV